MSAHTCQPPLIASPYAPMQPNWECGSCGRVWRDWIAGIGPLRYWAEVRGPSTAEGDQ